MMLLEERSKTFSCVVLLTFRLQIVLFSALALSNNNNYAFTSTRNKSRYGLREVRKTTTRAAIASTNNENLQREINVVQEFHTKGFSNGERKAILFSAKATAVQLEGYLIQNFETHSKNHSFEVHISSGKAMNNMDNFWAVFHTLLLKFLYIEEQEEENLLYKEVGDDERETRQQSSRCRPNVSGAKLRVSLEGIESDKLSETLQLSRIFLNNNNNGENNQDQDINNTIHNNSFDSNLGMYLPNYIPLLNEYIFKHRGTEQGNTSLKLMKMLCSRRVPYDFSPSILSSSKGSLDKKGDREIETQRKTNVVSLCTRILPQDAVEEITSVVEYIKRRNWLSINPDSVDGFPSLHLHLISNGNPIHELEEEEEDGDYNYDKEEEGIKVQSSSTVELINNKEVTYGECTSKIIDILQPYIYGDLLAQVKNITKSPNLEISDVFIRNYGEMIQIEEEHQKQERKTRYGLSPHFDVTAYTTCVVALDSTATTGKNGLYTIPSVPNNAASASGALRRFFPLAKGDGVLHTYDILHGVDIDPRLNRTSLVVWFVDRQQQQRVSPSSFCCQGEVNQPWLLNPKSDIEKFVLGLAAERTIEEDGTHRNLKKAINSLDFFISSAKAGNIFAMSTLGQMCDDELVPDTYYDTIKDILQKQSFRNPFLLLLENDSHNMDLSETSSSATLFEENLKCKSLTKSLWYHTSIYGGNRVSQISLADELMLEYLMMEKNEQNSKQQENILLMVGTLFTMALNQGYDYSVREALERLFDVECERLKRCHGYGVSSGEFDSQPVIKMLKMSV